MKFREFIENPKYSKTLHYWIDLVFGKRQQSYEDSNIYFSSSTEEYYNLRTEKSDVGRTTVESAAEFFHLPKKLFTNYHKALGSKDQNDENEEEELNSQSLLQNKFEVNINDIKITKDENIHNHLIDKGSYNLKNIPIDILT